MPSESDHELAAVAGLVLGRLVEAWEKRHGPHSQEEIAAFRLGFLTAVQALRRDEDTSDA